MQPTFHMSNGGAGAMEFYATFIVLWGLAVTVFWMICGWRAMRAHERLAESVERISQKQA